MYSNEYRFNYTIHSMWNILYVSTAVGLKQFSIELT